MSGLAIVTDTTADLPEDLVRQYDTTAIPLTVTVGGRSFLDRVELPDDEFYRRLLAAGRQVVDVHLSGALSGTCREAIGVAFYW